MGRNIVGILAAVCGGLLFVAFLGRPRLALTVWMLSLVMVPIWIGVDFFATVPAHCIVALIAVAATLSREPSRFVKFDAYITLLLAVSLAAVLLGDASPGLWIQMVVRWGVPYLAARVLISATGIRFAINLIAVLFGLVGALAALEFFLVWHPFVEWNNGSSEYAIWHIIQIRDGGDRSEWAFGHSIALGGSLALSIPFVVHSSYNWLTKIALAVAIGGGITVTASRSALAAAVLTAGICFVYVAKTRITRIAAFALSSIGVLMTTTFFGSQLQTWARATSDEERWSFDHRFFLYSTYLPKIELFERSSASSIGRHGASSIDSTIVRIGLEFGWIVLILALMPLVLCTVRVVIGRGSIAEIAIVGQIPLILTVALITQYESLIFFVAGVAVQMIIERSRVGVEAENSGALGLPDARIRSTLRRNSIRSGVLKEHASSSSGVYPR